MRALECSGPCPSCPWGRSSTRPWGWAHLVSDATRNWSTMTCAPFQKSPNCASHITRARCSATAYPNSKPITAASESRLSWTSKRVPDGAMELSGTYSLPVRTSKSTACRWLKVPRAVSCPDRRTGTPSSSSVPRASDSAVDQSTSPRPASSSARRFSSGISLGCSSKSAGTVLRA